MSINMKLDFPYVNIWYSMEFHKMTANTLFEFKILGEYIFDESTETLSDNVNVYIVTMTEEIVVSVCSDCRLL